MSAVVDAFEGQTRRKGSVPTQLRHVGVVANSLTLDADQLLASIQRIQKQNGIKPDTKVAEIVGRVGVDGRMASKFPNLTVEMETGTGKTYVYIRTALELGRRFGLRKYIVVVPSVAVREGVLKTLRITRRHFGRLYPGLSYRFYAYDS